MAYVNSPYVPGARELLLPLTGQSVAHIGLLAYFHKKHIMIWEHMKTKIIMCLDQINQILFY